MKTSKTVWTAAQNLLIVERAYFRLFDLKASGTLRHGEQGRILSAAMVAVNSVGPVRTGRADFKLQNISAICEALGFPEYILPGFKPLPNVQKAADSLLWDCVAAACAARKAEENAAAAAAARGAR